jgi:hypothetical protein
LEDATAGLLDEGLDLRLDLVDLALQAGRSKLAAAGLQRAGRAKERPIEPLEAAARRRGVIRHGPCFA